MQATAATAGARKCLLNEDFWRRDEAWSLQLLMVAPEHRSQGHRATLALATGVRGSLHPAVKIVISLGA